MPDFEGLRGKLDDDIITYTDDERGILRTRRPACRHKYQRALRVLKIRLSSSVYISDYVIIQLAAEIFKV